MNFFFYKKITLKSNFNSAKLFEILKSNSNPEMFDSNDNKPFKGFVLEDNSVWLKRNSLGRNSFRATIKGKIISNGQASALKLKFIMSFIGWIGLGFINFLILMLVLWSIDLTNLQFKDFSPLFITLFSYVLALLGFNYDMNKSLNELNRILK
jgi:hypothetical protein